MLLRSSCAVYVTPSVQENPQRSIELHAYRKNESSQPWTINIEVVVA